MTRRLNALEQRILGVLLEKSLSQPGQYPLSVNALLSGCNQKQNRDPVMAVTEEEVARIVTYLMVSGIATEYAPGQGARVVRYGHEAQAHYGWQRRSIAVMAELLLRGPQTVGELRSRCTRMVAFEDIDAVRIVIASLERHDPPYVETMPREPGKSAVRHRHLLGSDEPAAEPDRLSAVDGDVPGEVPAAAERPAVAPPRSRVEPAGAEALRGNEVASLSGQIESLTKELDALRSQLADLTGRVDDLEGLL